jgi:hypothetical protein
MGDFRVDSDFLYSIDTLEEVSASFEQLEHVLTTQISEKRFSIWPKRVVRYAPYPLFVPTKRVTWNFGGHVAAPVSISVLCNTTVREWDFCIQSNDSKRILNLALAVYAA